MSIGESVRSVYSNYAQFNGRASRSEYWWFQLFIVLAAIVLYIVGILLAVVLHTTAIAIVVSIAILVFYIASIIPSLAVLCRRLHDSDRSGWWFWIVLIPYIGSLILLILLLLPSTAGYNRFGPRAGDPPADAFAEYSGMARADAMAQFSQDAQRAAASGFQPVNQEWQRRGNGEVLVVAYRRAQGPQGWPTSPTPPWQSPNGGLS